MSLSYAISMFFINFLCLAIGYQEERQKRFEFLVKNKIQIESKLVQDIFSMLVPKFIEDSMIEQSISIYNNKS